MIEIRPLAQSRSECRSGTMAKARSSLKIKIELRYDPAFPFLGIYSKVLKIRISERY